MSSGVTRVPVTDSAGHLTPGLRCPNACFFCLQSNFFGNKYVPYLETGQDMFDVCVAIEKALGFRKFYVMDENFLKYPERAYELADLMAKHGKAYRFSIFSSAEIFPPSSRMAFLSFSQISPVSPAKPSAGYTKLPSPRPGYTAVVSACF